ncbi:MAG: hypothetical protein ACI9WL_001299 [Rubritalea sp.]|jgi:hypothetical protein
MKFLQLQEPLRGPISTSCISFIRYDNSYQVISGLVIGSAISVAKAVENNFLSHKFDDFKVYCDSTILSTDLTQRELKFYNDPNKLARTNVNRINNEPMNTTT